MPRRKVQPKSMVKSIKDNYPQDEGPYTQKQRVVFKEIKDYQRDNQKYKD